MQAYNKRKVQLFVVKKITVSLCILTEINKYFLKDVTSHNQIPWLKFVLIFF